jgi:4-hydroxy-3-methylbut-2-en-1-yl diphosphate reductase
MEIINIKPQSYCFGVLDAINLAKNLRINNPNQPIYIWGLLVHNQFVADALKYHQIITLERDKEAMLSILKKLTPGFVITSAHGISEVEISTIIRAGHRHIDATCSVIKNVMEIIKKELNQGHEVIYFGERNHPEMLAIGAIDSKKIHLVFTTDDIKNLNVKDPSPLFTNQTTLVHSSIVPFYYELIKKFPQARLLNEICDATRVRQEALIKHLDQGDIAIIVGDQKSNNTKKLYEIAKAKIKDTYWVSSVAEIKRSWFESKQTLLITAGASTPPYLVKQIIDMIKGDPVSLDYSKLI